MRHKHRISPGYEGGEYVEGNVVELTPTQHAMWHFAEWQRKGNWQDKLAWQGLSKMLSHADVLKARLSEAGRKGGAIRAAQLRGRRRSEDEKKRLRSAMLGRKKTFEMRVNSSNAAKLRWQRPDARRHCEHTEKMWMDALSEVDFSDKFASSRIANELGVSSQIVRRWAKKLGLRPG